MARNPARERELQEQSLQPGFVLADVRIDLAVRALEIGIRNHRRSAMPRPGQENHIEVVLFDDPVQVRINEVLPGRRTPMSQQHALHIAGLERKLQQRIRTQIHLSDGQVIRCPPPGVDDLSYGMNRRRLRVLRDGRHHRSDLQFREAGHVLEPSVRSSNDTATTPELISCIHRMMRV